MITTVQTQGHTAGLLQPDFPPLLKGIPLGAAVDPFAAAIKAAQDEAAQDEAAQVMLGMGDGVTPGLVHYAQRDDVLRAAVTFAPEVPLSQAIGVLWAVQLGFADALGALAPPEVAVQFDWPGGLRVNGARCGGFRACASTQDPLEEPDWLVVGLEVALRLHADSGETPDQTALSEEGCAEITAPELLESWSRHMLVWVHSYLHEGLGPLHESYRGKVQSIGEDITMPEPGHFTGLDEAGGMILRLSDSTTILPLTQILEQS